MNKLSLINLKKNVMNFLYTEFSSITRAEFNPKGYLKEPFIIFSSWFFRH